MIEIRRGEHEAAARILSSIPELYQTPDADAILARIEDKDGVILTAYVNNMPAGCKIGYVRDEGFYSWLGGVLPDFRRMKVAGLLADQQENIARSAGHTHIWMKTRNAFPQMILMAVSRGFQIIDFIPDTDVRQHRIVLRKSL